MTTRDRVFTPFESWAAALEYVERNGLIYYHAPLDYRPVYMRAKLSKARRKIRIIPLERFADPFWADEGHLDRLFAKA